MRYFRWTGFSVTILSVYLFLASMHPAHAYLDPGTGSYLFQTGLVVVLGGVYVVKHHLDKIGALLRSHFGRSATSPLHGADGSQ